MLDMCGVEILWFIGFDGLNFEGVDIDLMSVFVVVIEEV